MASRAGIPKNDSGGPRGTGDRWYGGRSARLEHWLPNPNHGCIPEGSAGPGGGGHRVVHGVVLWFSDICNSPGSVRASYGNGACTRGSEKPSCHKHPEENESQTTAWVYC